MHPACPRLDSGAGGRPDVRQGGGVHRRRGLAAPCSRCGCALAGAGPSCPGTCGCTYRLDGLGEDPLPSGKRWTSLIHTVGVG
ncbi:hypothetical protein [Azospirillum largimobile]